MSDTIELASFIGFLVATIRLSTPLLLAALGELIAERAGVLNLGVEGMMLTGALFGFLGVHYSGSLLVGWGLAIVAGAAMALVFAIFAISLRCHQVIVALGINLLALGGTGFLYRLLFGVSSTAPQIVPAGPLDIPLLSEIPVIGEVFFQQTPLVYVTFALVPLVWYVIHKTPVGLTLRSVGENALAADTVGIRVQAVRYAATLIGGGMAGLAGAYLSTTSLNVFLEGMTGGTGWIAVAIVILGNWSTVGIMLGSLMFGGAMALQLRLQNAGIAVPREFIVMLPYILTLVALTGLVRRSSPPALLCIPFFRAGRE